jgi:hypothetical protein
LSTILLTPKLERPGTFLLDPANWINLGTRHIWVHFNVEYDGGRHVRRCAKTAVPSRFVGPHGPVGREEVALAWTDNKGNLRSDNVPVKYLGPAVPMGKGKEGIVLKGRHQGTLVVVKKYSRKTKVLEVAEGGEYSWEEPEDNVCRVELPV